MRKFNGLFCLIFTLLSITTLGSIAFFRRMPPPPSYQITYMDDFDVYSAMPDGSSIRRFAHTPHRDAVWGVSADGEWLLLSPADIFFQGQVIYAMHRSRQELEPLLYADIANQLNYVDMSWNADGTWLLYGTMSFNNMEEVGIGRMNRITGEQQTLFQRETCPASNPNARAYVRKPVWSPDEAWVYFEVQTCDYSFALYRIRLTDGYVEAVVTEGYRAGQHWSPDGEWIAFIGTDQQGYQAVFRVRPDGSDRQRITDQSYYIFPVTDANWLYLHTDYSLYRVRWDGTDFTRLTQGDTWVAALATPEWLYYENHHTPSQFAIHSINLTTLADQNLTPHLADMRLIGLSPDQEWVYFSEHTQPAIVDYQVYRMRVGGSQLEKLPMTTQGGYLYWLPLDFRTWHPERLALSVFSVGLMGLVFQRRRMA